jgi:hypothetical protein
VRRYEKVLLAGFLTLSVALFVFACSLGARAYTGPANCTSATIGDMRVNPSQSVTWTPGPVLNATGQPVGGGNSSLSFDGVNQCVTAPPTGLLASAGAVEIRFKVPDYTPLGTLFSMRTTATDELRAAFFTDALYIEVGDSSFSFATAGIAEDEWTSLIVTWNLSTHHVEAYIGGVSKGSSNGYNTGVSILPAVAIAARDDLSNYLVGGVDEVRFYNRTLTPAEIPLHAQGVHANDAGLMLYLPFDGDVLDSSGMGNDGTAFNGPAYAEGLAAVPMRTYYDGAVGLDRWVLVNSTTGDVYSALSESAPAAWGNYTAVLAPDASIGNATIPVFIVDTIALDLHAVYSTVPTSLPATVYANAYSLIDGANLTAADSLTVNGYAFTWNTYTSRLETQITKATTQSYTLNTVTALSEATYGITAGTVTTPVTIIVIQRGSSLIYQYLALGDVGGLIFSVYTQALNLQVTWLIIMIIGSVFLYRRLGAIPTALIWLLSWGGFVAVFPPVAVNLAVGMLLFGVAGLIFLVFFYWRRSTT